MHLHYFKFSVARRHFLFKVSCSNVAPDHFICKKKIYERFSYCLSAAAYGYGPLENTCVHRTSSLANEGQISSETQFNNKNVTEQLKTQLSEYNGGKRKKGTRYCL
jgi:hypothetical protein